MVPVASLDPTTVASDAPHPDDARMPGDPRSARSSEIDRCTPPASAIARARARHGPRVERSDRVEDRAPDAQDRVRLERGPAVGPIGVARGEQAEQAGLHRVVVVEDAGDRRAEPADDVADEVAVALQQGAAFSTSRRRSSRPSWITRPPRERRRSPVDAVASRRPSPRTGRRPHAQAVVDLADSVGVGERHAAADLTTWPTVLSGWAMARARRRPRMRSTGGDGLESGAPAAAPGTPRPHSDRRCRTAHHVCDRGATVARTSSPAWCPSWSL